MREQMIDLLERADYALAVTRETSGVSLEEVARSLAAIRDRLMFPDDVVVAALAGGTGSGKSSLFNALNGVDVALAGPMRPTTDTPMAAVPSGLESVFTGHLTQLGLDEVLTQTTMPSVCLIDLPDTDSVNVEHRLRVERLLPRIDLVVWVVDPEKYRDAALHVRYLRPLSNHQDRFLFVLNHIDRLQESVRATVVDDLWTALTQDGLFDPEILLTSAAPPAGPPLGIEELRSALDKRARVEGGLYHKLLIELGEAADVLVRKTTTPLAPVTDLKLGVESALARR